MNYSPKLKEAAEEIKEILVKHDIGGIVILHETRFTEYVYKLDPSYSAITYTKTGIKIKGSDQEKLANSANLLRSLAETGGYMILKLIELSEQVDKALGAEHDDPIHTPHED